MDRKIAVVGLGYVGLPVAVAFGRKTEVVGFDINSKRIDELKNGYDRTNEIDSKGLLETNLIYTSDHSELKKADFIIVAVPTPINQNNQPDLTPLIKASEVVGSVVEKGSIIVFESTVYPGATEEICIPILEKKSGKKCGEDFFVGYSPERINPGDKEHTFETITKVVSGQNEDVLNIVADTYSMVVKAGVHKAPSIKVAEAAKVIENTQRDVNIALMNELALIFNKAGINTKDVLEAAKTKWNFLSFYPGLVGGHCIGVDPYYLTYKAQEMGYHPEIILAGRRINDDMPQYISSTIIKLLIQKGLMNENCRVNLFGVTFKENCPDLRNSKVIDIIKELNEYGIEVIANDIVADSQEAMQFYNVELVEYSDMEASEVVVFAVSHDDYKMNKDIYLKKLKSAGIVIDIKGIINEEDLRDNQSLWRL